MLIAIEAISLRSLHFNAAGECETSSLLISSQLKMSEHRFIGQFHVLHANNVAVACRCRFVAAQNKWRRIRLMFSSLYVYVLCIIFEFYSVLGFCWPWRARSFHYSSSPIYCTCAESELPRRSPLGLARFILHSAHTADLRECVYFRLNLVTSALPIHAQYFHFSFFPIHKYSLIAAILCRSRLVQFVLLLLFDSDLPRCAHMCQQPLGDQITQNETFLIVCRINVWSPSTNYVYL